MSIRVYVDQGHNPVNPNAGAEGNGLREQDIVFEIGLRLADLLNESGNYEARLSRPTADTQLGTSTQTSLSARVNAANAWPADYFISLHCNASVNAEANGTEALVYSASGRETTVQLGKAIESALPKFAEHKFLAKVYQALRIEVNQEMKSLEKFLSGAAKSLKEGGKMVIITYHSLEDRMVKNFIKAGNIEGKAEKDFYGNITAPLKAVNRKPILPQESEIASNTRARSAKLRIAEKV